jgi:hypothetical protein
MDSIKEYVTEAVVKQESEHLYPHSEFKPLTGARGVMSEASNPFDSTNKP